MSMVRASNGNSHERVPRAQWLDLATTHGSHDRRGSTFEAVDRAPFPAVRAAARAARAGYHAVVQRGRGVQLPVGSFGLAALAVHRPGDPRRWGNHLLDEAAEGTYTVAAVLRLGPYPGRSHRKCDRP